MSSETFMATPFIANFMFLKQQQFSKSPRFAEICRDLLGTWKSMTFVRNLYKFWANFVQILYKSKRFQGPQQISANLSKSPGSANLSKSRGSANLSKSPLGTRPWGSRPPSQGARNLAEVY